MPADIGTITNPKHVLDKLKEIEVAPIVAILSTNFNIVFRVFYFFFRLLTFIFEVSDHFFKVLN